MFEQAFKNIDDILHKDDGCGSELDYVEQGWGVSWPRHHSEGRFPSLRYNALSGPLLNSPEGAVSANDGHRPSKKGNSPEGA